MTYKFIERLIIAVKREPIIYNLNHPSYRNNELKTAAWIKISRDLNESVCYVKMKWRSLRDCYAKSKRAHSSLPIDSHITKYKNWRWSPKLKFIDNFDETSSNDKFEQNSESGSDSGQLDDNDNTTYQKDEDQVVEEANIKSERIENEDKPQHEKIFLENEPIRNSLSDKEFKIILTTLPASKRKILSNHKKYNRNNFKAKVQYTEIDYLFKSYAETFKKFSAVTQIKLKAELAKLFTNAELKEIGKGKKNKRNSDSNSSSESYDTYQADI